MRTKTVTTKLTKRALRMAEQQALEAAHHNQQAQEEYRLNKPIFGPLTARNPKQKQLLEDLQNEAIRMMFLIGPAGTGKTFVPTSYAVEQLVKGEIERIVITRPMVGCDEDMGFLPGDENEKFANWVGPFLEIIEGKLGKKKAEWYQEQGMIVAKPLMMMRGMTHRKAIVILDEAQNTTTGQMKMFLTRAGQGTRLIINGDVEQSDLPDDVQDGLSDALSLFGESRIAALHEFDDNDITRDPLVREVVKAYRRRYATSEPVMVPAASVAPGGKLLN